PGHLGAHAPVQERTAATAVSRWQRIRHRERLRVVMDQETFLRGRAHRDALPALRHVKVTVADAAGSERGPLLRHGHSRVPATWLRVTSASTERARLAA